jgi:hypothetical protein
MSIIQVTQGVIEFDDTYCTPTEEDIERIKAKFAELSKGPGPLVLPPGIKYTPAIFLGQVYTTDDGVQMIATTPNPIVPMVCESCPWRGMLRDAVTTPNTIAVCPKCGKAVEMLIERLSERTVTK